VKLDNIEAWNAHAMGAVVSTKDAGGKCFYGVSIGPDSHDAVVRVNGTLLQAGCGPLALRGNNYNIERVTPDLPAIEMLQLQLLESPEELAAATGHRPNHRWQKHDGATPDALTLRLRVPFVGRRLAHFVIQINGEVVRYQVKAWTGPHADGTTEAVDIIDESGSWTTTISFYVGGTDHAENYAQLDLYVQATAGDEMYVRAETIGEIGRP